MKKFSTLFGACIAATCFLTFSSFNTGDPVKDQKKPFSSYSITLVSRGDVGANEEWVWMLYNPNPGNGNNGTLQDVSHWDMALPPAAEAALVSAQYSRNGDTWNDVTIEMDRDPSIRACTSIDVLKYNVGTNGSDPVYFKATFNKKFTQNAYATSWIKTGGGMQGCNLFYFAGVGAERFD